MSSENDLKTPSKAGQIVKFHSPQPDEDPEQEYEISEIHFDVKKPRAAIKPVDTNLNLPPKITVLVEELELVEDAETKKR